MLAPLSPRCIWFAVRLCVGDLIAQAFARKRTGTGSVGV